MKKLFMVSLGGKAPGSNIEVHDVQFVVGESIEEIIPMLKANWYGIELKLHIDSYLEIKGADRYEVSLSEELGDQAEQLYFVFLGGYSEGDTQEMHQPLLMVCRSREEAKARALAAPVLDGKQVHADSVVCVSEVLVAADGVQYGLELSPTEETYDLVPEWFGYWRLDLE